MNECTSYCSYHWGAAFHLLPFSLNLLSSLLLLLKALLFLEFLLLPELLFTRLLTVVNPEGSHSVYEHDTLRIVTARPLIYLLIGLLLAIISIYK